MKRIFLAVAFLLFLGAFTYNFGQANASLGGTVSDASGALIPGVTLTAKHTQTGVSTTAVTNESGSYQFPNLQTGTYTVSAELSGFRTQAYNDVALGIGSKSALTLRCRSAAWPTRLMFR